MSNPPHLINGLGGSAGNLIEAVSQSLLFRAALDCQNGVVFDDEQGLAQAVVQVDCNATPFIFQPLQNSPRKSELGRLLPLQSPLQQLNPQQRYHQNRQQYPHRGGGSSPGPPRWTAEHRHIGFS